MSSEAQDVAIRVLGAHYEEIVARKGVVAVGVGVRERGGQIVTEELCIFVEVVAKLPKSELDASQALPTTIDGIGVDVVELREVMPQILFMPASELANTEPYRPLIGGSQITNNMTDAGGFVAVGTLGANVYVKPGGDSPDAPFVGMVSNDHVMFANNAVKYSWIWQPGTNGTNVGSVYAGQKDAEFPKLDVAVASTFAGIAFTNNVLVIGELTGIGQPTVQTRVRKYGRTTQYTEGYLAKIDVMGAWPNEVIVGLRICFGWPTPDTSQKFSDDGDSGAVIVDDGNVVVGLLWGGGSSAPYFSSANAMPYISARWTSLTIPVPVGSQLVGLLTDSDRLDAYRASLERNVRGRKIAQGIASNFKECKTLIHTQKECAQAWRSVHGAAFIPIRETAPSAGPHHLKKAIDGVTLGDMLSTMAEHYIRHGSPQLVYFVRTYGEDIMRHANSSVTVEDLIDALCDSEPGVTTSQ